MQARPDAGGGFQNQSAKPYKKITGRLIIAACDAAATTPTTTASRQSFLFSLIFLFRFLKFFIYGRRRAVCAGHADGK